MHERLLQEFQDRRSLVLFFSPPFASIGGHPETFIPPGRGKEEGRWRPVAPSWVSVVDQRRVYVDVKLGSPFVPVADPPNHPPQRGIFPWKRLYTQSTRNHVCPSEGSYPCNCSSVVRREEVRSLIIFDCKYIVNVQGQRHIIRETCIY